MKLGTAGAPLDLIQMILSQAPEDIDFNEVFSRMAAAGQTVFLPFSIYEEIPDVKSTGYEALFFPPAAGPDPYVAIREQIFTAMEANGIKLIVPAALLYPQGTVPASDDPLLALLETVGDRDLLAAFYTYDEPVLQGVPITALQTFYEHVKSIRPDLPVIQVNAGVQAGMDINAYLDAVKVTAQYADMMGWSIYGTDLPGAGLLSPYSDEAIVDRVTAVGDYARWVEETLPDKLRLGILQGFGIADLFSDEAAAEFPPEVVAAAQAPSIYIMSELARAMQDVDWLVWYGPSYLEDSDGRAWQDILDVSESIADSIGAVEDQIGAENAISEFAEAGTATGIKLDLELDADEDRETPTYSVNDDRFEVKKNGLVLLKQEGSIDYDAGSQIELIGAARFADGRIATKTFVLTVLDELEQFRGTEAGEELVGTRGRDFIWGLGGDDVLWGLDGDDRLTGGEGNDFFVFQENEGVNTVTDFTRGGDKIVLVGSGMLEIGSSGRSAVIEFGGTEVLLRGVDAQSLSEEDFMFFG